MKTSPARPVSDDSLAPGAVVAEDLWERFRVYQSRPRGIKDRLFRFERAVYEDLWAVKGVSFSLEPGETFAILGANGSGKSTLLKVLARILPPTRGRVAIGGKLASLLELGAGFHGDLTGRENIYLNGAIMGLNRRRIDDLRERIIDFSGVRDFIDNPVRNFSSGMYVRLGFAVAVHVDPDVLLIDEILAVGDAAFQEKCYDAMQDFKRRGKTMILVTHDLDAAHRLCDHGILLDHGTVVAAGTTREIVDEYRRRILKERIEESSETKDGAGSAHEQGWGTGEATVTGVELHDAGGDSTAVIRSGDDASFHLRVRFDADVTDPIFGFILRASDGDEVYNTNTMWRGIETGTFKAGDVAEVRFGQRLHLLPGRYLFTTAVAHSGGREWYHWWDDCFEFHVVGETRDQGRVALDSRISFEVVSR